MVQSAAELHVGRKEAPPSPRKNTNARDSTVKRYQDAAPGVAQQCVHRLQKKSVLISQN